MIVVQWNTDVLDRQPPAWLESRRLRGHRARRAPSGEHIDVPSAEQLIVELYTK